MNVNDLDKYCPRGLNKSVITPDEVRTAPFNDTCIQMFFHQLQVSLRRFNEWEEILYTSIYIVISVLAVIGNGLVILAVVRKKSMRTNRNVLILNLALSNLVLGMINIPFLWLPSIDFEFPYSRLFCKFANVLPGSNIYCSTLTISVMAIDRYYSVKRLKMSSNRRQCMHAVFVSLGIWILSFCLSLPLLIYYDTSVLFVVKDVNVRDDTGVRLRSYGWRQCKLVIQKAHVNTTEDPFFELSTKHIQLIMSVLQVTFLYVVPLFVLSIFNVKLTRFLKTNANQMSRNRGQANNKRHTEPRKPENNQMLSHSLRSPSLPSIRSSIAERASDKRTSRTTSLLIAMAGSYAVLWLPFTLISFLLDLDILYNETHVAIIERIDQTCKMVSMLSICVNPFLYGFLNTNFRHEFSEIFFRYLRCTKRHWPQTRITHDYSSVAIPSRHNSLHQDRIDDEDSLFAALRRSIRGSARKIGGSMRSNNSLHHSFRAKVKTHVSVSDQNTAELGEERSRRESFPGRNTAAPSPCDSAGLVLNETTTILLPKDVDMENDSFM